MASRPDIDGAKTPRNITMTDELREKLARIDPMHPGVPTRSVTDESSRQLLETIMSTETRERTDSSGAPNRTWTLAVAALAALVVAVGGIIALGEGAGETPQAAAIELNAGGEDAFASCIQFSPEELARVAELAFEGTVTAVDGPEVTLTVSEWFKGGEPATEVVLNAPLGMEALIGGIPFEVGGQYLISAQDGNVNYCGFSGPSTPEYRAAFETAFGS
jgi:hypothetical protein